MMCKSREELFSLKENMIPYKKGFVLLLSLVSSKQPSHLQSESKPRGGHRFSGEKPRNQARGSADPGQPVPRLGGPFL